MELRVRAGQSCAHKNMAPGAPALLLTPHSSRNHSLRETKSQFIWKTRLTHLSSALITERRVLAGAWLKGSQQIPGPSGSGAGGDHRWGVLCISAAPRPLTRVAFLPSSSEHLPSHAAVPTALQRTSRVGMRQRPQLRAPQHVVKMNLLVTWCWSVDAETGFVVASGACLQNAGVLSPRLGPGAEVDFLPLPAIPFSGGDFPKGCPRG